MGAEDKPWTARSAREIRAVCMLLQHRRKGPGVWVTGALACLGEELSRPRS